MSKKLVSILVHTPFKLTLEDNSVFEYKKGRHNVPQEHASHWFTLHHAEVTDAAVNTGGDQQPLIDSLLEQITDKDTQIASKDTLIGDLKTALTQLQEQTDSLNAQIVAKDTLIATLQSGDGGTKDAEKSKSANGK